MGRPLVLPTLYGVDNINWASSAYITVHPLASRSTSGGFQDGHPGLPVTVRHGSSLSGRRLPVGLRRRSSSAACCHIEDMRCETNLQQLWRQVHCSCRSEAVKQPSNWTATSWH